MALTNSFQILLTALADTFTAPSFVLFGEILCGWVLSTRHRFVTELIFSSGSIDKKHWSCFHRFFSKNAWELDTLNMHLAVQVCKILTFNGTILLAIDDTLCRKRGLDLYGAGMHHDPLMSSKGKKITNWGHDWVVLCVIIVNPFWAPTKVYALPIAERLYKNRQGRTKGKNKKQEANKAKAANVNSTHRTRPELALELIELVAEWFPGERLMILGDSLYGGKSILRRLPENVDLISHVHSKGVLYEPAPPVDPNGKGKGRPRKKGARLPSMEEWADDAELPWEEMTFDQFGLHGTFQIKTQQALYYTAGGERLLNIVLSKDTKGGRPMQRFYCTRLDWDARQILSAYASRWAIEVTFENAKQLLGLEDPANRLPKAVERTAPTALALYTLIVVWFHEEGHRHLRFPNRPWYPKKREPSFADILTTLRRISWAEEFSRVCPEGGVDENLSAFIDQLIEFTSRAG